MGRFINYLFPCKKKQGFGIIFRVVAQLVVYLVWDQDVAGSSPVYPTKNSIKFIFVFSCIIQILFVSLQHEKKITQSLKFDDGCVCLVIRNRKYLLSKLKGLSETNLNTQFKFGGMPNKVEDRQMA